MLSGFLVFTEPPSFVGSSAFVGRPRSLICRRAQQRQGRGPGRGESEPSTTLQREPSYPRSRRAPPRARGRGSALRWSSPASRSRARGGLDARFALVCARADPCRLPGARRAARPEEERRPRAGEHRVRLEPEALVALSKGAGSPLGGARSHADGRPRLPFLREPPALAHQHAGGGGAGGRSPVAPTKNGKLTPRDVVSGTPRVCGGSAPKPPSRMASGDRLARPRGTRLPLLLRTATFGRVQPRRERAAPHRGVAPDQERQTHPPGRDGGLGEGRVVEVPRGP